MTTHITFVPAWAANVVRARGAAFNDTRSVLSIHDHFHFLLANLLFEQKLIGMGINADEFTTPVGDWNETYNESDTMFALYGANKEKSAGEWDLASFDIHLTVDGGYTVVENPSAGAKDLLLEYLVHVDMLKGRAAAFASSAFRIYLERHVGKPNA